MRIVTRVGAKQNRIRNRFRVWLRNYFDRMPSEGFYRPEKAAKDIGPVHRRARQEAADTQSAAVAEMVAAARAEARARAQARARQNLAEAEARMDETVVDLEGLEPPTPEQAATLPDPEDEPSAPAPAPTRADRPKITRRTVPEDPRGESGLTWEEEIDRAFERFRYETAVADAAEDAAREEAWKRLEATLDTDIQRAADEASTAAMVEINARATDDDPLDGDFEPLPDFGTMTHSQIVDWARAQQDAWEEDGSGRPITGYRRVVHPELSESGVCGLCLAAAARLYQTADLLPIHTRCRCTVVPVVEGQDLGAWMNQESLRQAAKGDGWTAAVRYRVDEHGEVGATLAYDPQAGRARKAIRKAAEASKGKTWRPESSPRALADARDRLARFEAIAASAPAGESREQARTRATYWRGQVEAWEKARREYDTGH